MNSLAKLQLLMSGFLLLLFAAMLYDLLLLAPSVLLFVLQLPIIKTQLRKEYPEDWIKYASVFIFFEAVMVALVLIFMSMSSLLLSSQGMYLMLTLVLFVIVATVAVKFLISRRFCYGTVLFSTKGWVGVSIKNDLFSKINEANYAVENPLDVPVKKGDRVKVRVKGNLGKTVPYEIAEVVK